MTFILAANLSDRILLATDTVVTRLSADGSRGVVCYYPKLQHFSNGNNTQFVSFLFAGNLGYARFLSRKISGALDEGRLPCDIVDLQREIPSFITDFSTGYPDKKKATFIVAGRTYDGSLDLVDFGRFSEIIGPSAGQVTDPVMVAALQMASKIGGLEKWNGRVPVMLPRQAIFRVSIDENKNVFEVSDLLGKHQMMTAGTRLLTREEENKLLRFFLDKRAIEVEGKDLVNFMRNQFSDSIGGAVMLGYIDGREGVSPLRYVGYELDRSSGTNSDKNWSFRITDGKFIAVSPNNEEIDLLTSHYEEAAEGGLEI